MLIYTNPRRRIFNSNDEKLNLKIRDRELDLVDKIKYLGVHVDDSWIWNEHLKSVISKALRGIGMIKHAKNYLPEASLKSLYLNFVEPYFRFCRSVRGTCGITEKN